MKQVVAFREMKEEEFAKWKESSIADYEIELIKAGQCTKVNAYIRAKTDFEAILPQGKKTPHNYIFNAMNRAGEKVGFIWYETTKDSSAYIADFEVKEKYRRQGYGTGILEYLEKMLQEQGVDNIMLHVFEHNRSARLLYVKSGYEIVQTESAEEGSIYMRKCIG